jgi:endonuclease/exonuclease/phosphatase family metal-dependent hydrolase
MTWNVRYFSHGTGGLRATDQHMRRMAWALAALDPLPDVFAFQEVENGSLRGGARPQTDAFLELFEEALRAHRRDRRFQGLYFPAHRYQLGERSLYTTGLAVVTCDRIGLGAAANTDITHVRIRAMAGLKQRRIAARVELRPPGWDRPLHLVNTHLSLPAFLQVGPHRVPEKMGHGVNQLAEIENLLAALDPDEATVVVGDFNSAPGSPAYERMRAAGWIDGSSSHDAPTAAFLHHRMHIDHVFGSPRVKFREVRVAHQGPLAGLSDHAPKIGVVEPC